MVYHWLKSYFTQWLPQSCVLCGHSSRQHALCPACLEDLPGFSHEICRQCGLPLNGATPPHACGHCQQLRPDYDHVISAFAYAPPVSQLVAKLKFRGQIQLARLLGELLAKKIESAGRTQAQALLPVPLHPARLRQRGFNQALEIARPLTQTLGLPLLSDCIQRCRDTRPQSDQAATQRERNIRGAFGIHQPPTYSRIAIVDDVMTSGHTVNEIAKLLRTAGVEQIEVWCVARAWPHTQLVENRHERSQGKA
jgi:ComF family protein